MIEAPLTFSQWQLWERMSTQPEDLATLYSHFEIDGRFDVAAFLESLKLMVRDHEALRIRLVPTGDGAPPRQRLWEAPQRSELISLRKVPAASAGDFTRYVRGFVAKELDKPWQLTDSYPFRMFLFQYSGDLHAFVALFSHLAVDARGRSLFETGLWARYAAAVEPAARFPESPRKISFMAAASRRANPQDFAAAIDFWVSQAPTIPPRLPPAADRSLDDRRIETAEVIALHGSALTAVRQRARQSRSTEFQWILGVFGTALAELTSAEAVKITTPVDTRRADEQDVIGMFATALPIVVFPAGDPVKTQARVRRRLAELLAHRDVPPTAVAQVRRAAAHAAGAEWRYDVNIEYVRDEPPTTTLDGGRLTVRSDVYEPRIQYRNQGVILTISSTAERLDMNLTYARDSPVTGGPDGLGHRLQAGLIGVR